MSMDDSSKNQDLLEVIDITPDISLMPKLGFAGYSAPQAIGELVDNAIDARIDSKVLNVSIKIQKDSVSVADNGTGMDKQVASKSFVLAFSRKTGQLGEFGLGMKTACLSLGDYFEIITSALGDKFEYQICFDKKEWESSDKGWKVPLRKKEAKEDVHFTIININRLKVFYPNLHNYIRDDLQRRYAPFIRAGQVQLKVNDKMGNPILIASVLVWQVEDTYMASFNVDNYEQFVKIQADSALRQMASKYAYDTFEDEHASVTLRGSGDEINEVLEQLISERLALAGLKVVEARISHLSYAPEIATAMLQRQQATAVVAARTKIVEGAVGMVQMALAELSKREIVHLDDEKKASMVSNLLVVLCSEKSATPVLNSGSLY